MKIMDKASRLEQFSDLVHLIYAASAEPHRWTDAVAAVAQSMQAQLGLKPAECRVTNGLAQGANYREVASKLGIGEETVRYHVKSVYAKTRTNNKAGLTRLVLSLAWAAV